MLIKKILSKCVDEISLVNKILSYLGSNECEKCGTIQSSSLTVIISWKIGNYDLKDIKGNDYELKKVCQTCIYMRCSKITIYKEILNNELMYPL